MAKLRGSVFYVPDDGSLKDWKFILEKISISGSVYRVLKQNGILPEGPASSNITWNEQRDKYKSILHF